MTDTPVNLAKEKAALRSITPHPSMPGRVRLASIHSITAAATEQKFLAEKLATGLKRLSGFTASSALQAPGTSKAPATLASRQPLLLTLFLRS